MRQTQRLSIEIQRRGSAVHFDIVLDMPLGRVRRDVYRLARCESYHETLDFIDDLIVELDQLAATVHQGRKPVVIDRHRSKTLEGG